MTDSHMPAASEVKRLEQLWEGSFGDDYVDRNRSAYGNRQAFWTRILEQLSCERVLEVGCNVGGNLQWIADLVPPSGVFGVDVNRKALAELRVAQPELNSIWSPARDLPFRDRFFDLTFTMGVLIHQPDDTLPLVMSEIVRTSREWVLCGEYHAETPTEVPYRGQEGALFKRDYGSLYQRLFPELRLERTGFLGVDEGWDDVTWWLFRRA